MESVKSTRTIFRCIPCDKVFESKYDYNQHMKYNRRHISKAINGNSKTNQKMTGMPKNNRQVNKKEE